MLAEACRDAGIVFVGPTPEAMRLLGSKREAKSLARQAGVPVVPGYDGQDQSPETLAREAERIGFPLLIKASAGGGGKGMRAVHTAADFAEALESAKREARSAFGDDTVLLERLVERPRHIEVQVLADAHGSAVYLGERECSVQRRHQKVIEESPAPGLSPEQRRRMGEAAVALVRAAGYVNAGTVEFIQAPGGEFYFLEVNTRLQVEHPVTELVTGLDLVREQLRIAAGERLSFSQADVHLRGHAIECRVYAEDPAHGFRPSTGKVLLFQPPSGPGIRNDVGLETGDEVTPFYDPMLAKLIVSAADREGCIARLEQALRRYPVLGVTTNLSLVQAIVRRPEFHAGTVWTQWLDGHLDELVGTAEAGETPALPGGLEEVAGFWRRTASARAPEPNPWKSPAVSLRSDGDGTFQAIGQNRVLIRDGTGMRVAWIAEDERATHVFLDGRVSMVPRERGLSIDDVAGAESSSGGAAAGGRVEASLPGVIAKVNVRPGESVSAGQPLIVLEAMKMEIAIQAPIAGTVRAVHGAAGDLVQAGTVLAEIGPADEPAGDTQ
jgi:3-methylcrotonyl-CoA carboxylase alpha subunit